MHHVGGGTQRRRLEDPDEVCDVLERDFAIAVPHRAAVIQRLVALEGAAA